MHEIQKLAVFRIYPVRVHTNSEHLKIKILKRAKIIRQNIIEIVLAQDLKNALAVNEQKKRHSQIATTIEEEDRERKKLSFLKGGFCVPENNSNSSCARRFGALHYGQLARLHDAHEPFADCHHHRGAVGITAARYRGLAHALFLIYVAYLQSSVLFETRRHARELQAQRELTEHAEISRINELRVSLETQLTAVAKQNEAAKEDILTRLSQAEGDLRQSVEHCQNSLAAAIAEIDDRLTRGTGQSAPRKLA